MMTNNSEFDQRNAASVASSYLSKVLSTLAVMTRDEFDRNSAILGVLIEARVTGRATLDPSTYAVMALGIASDLLAGHSQSLSDDGRKEVVDRLIGAMKIIEAAKRRSTT